MARGAAATTWLVAGLAAQAAAQGRAGVTTGHYRGSDSWRYLDRFCFEKGDGGIVAEFMFPRSATPKLMAYYLEGESANEFLGWTSVYSEDKTCRDRYAIAEETSGTVFNLQDSKFFQRLELVDGESYVVARVDTRLATSRSRWFFFAVGNCERECASDFCEGGLDLYWSLTLTNGESAGKYFGANVSNVFSTAVGFLLGYIVLCFYMSRVRAKLLDKRKYHTTVKLLAASISAAAVRVLCDLVALSNYRREGVSLPTWETISLVAASVAEVTLLCKIMLIMKGWTIVRRKISANGRMRLTVYIMVYTTAYWMCLLYYRFGIDKALVVYVYDSWPGYVLVSLRVLLLAWMMRAKALTLQRYDSKRGFYSKFMVFSALWILSLPVLVFVNHFVVEYMREKLLYGLEILFLFVAQWTLVALYNPDSALFGQSFPFHATTSSMLAGRMGQGSASSKASLSETHIRQAAEIGRRIKTGVLTLQTFASDLTSFLDEIDPASDELLVRDEDLPGAGEPSCKPSSISKRGPSRRAKPQAVDPRTAASNPAAAPPSKG